MEGGIAGGSDPRARRVERERSIAVLTFMATGADQ